MTGARESILESIRSALADREDLAEAPAATSYITTGSLGEQERIELFQQRLREYGAEVHVPAQPLNAIAECLQRHGAKRVVCAPDLAPALRPEGFDLVEDRELSPNALDHVDAVITTCAVACAATGSIALDGGPGQGRRAISLVPDLHICVVGVRQVVETVPELIQALRLSAIEGRPIVIASGPSATSDIEMNRVEGVHGPRKAVVVLDKDS
jgi:L-lactate dehydrogenase complex protein LldG